MKNTSLLTLLVIVSGFVAGCMSVHFDAAGYDRMASLTSSERKFTLLKHFSRDVKCWYTLVGLIPLSDTDLSGILKDETASAHGDAVLNIKVHGETTLLDAAIPVATAFFGSVVSPQRGALLGLLVTARTYTIEGDVIKYVE